MQKAKQINLFAKIATEVKLGDTYRYWDASDPDNIKRGVDFYKNNLYFLKKNEKQELLRIWRLAAKDGRNAKLLINAANTLAKNYEEENSPIYYL